MGEGKYGRRAIFKVAALFGANTFRADLFESSGVGEVWIQQKGGGDFLGSTLGYFYPLGSMKVLVQTDVRKTQL